MEKFVCEDNKGILCRLHRGAYIEGGHDSSICAYHDSRIDMMSGELSCGQGNRIVSIGQLKARVGNQNIIQCGPNSHIVCKGKNNRILTVPPCIVQGNFGCSVRVGEHPNITFSGILVPEGQYLITEDEILPLFEEGAAHMQDWAFSKRGNRYIMDGFSFFGENAKYIIRWDDNKKRLKSVVGEFEAKAWKQTLYSLLRVD